MVGRARALGATGLVALALGAGGCGSHAPSRHTRTTTTVAPTTAAVQGTVAMVASTFPDSLDPQVGDTPQSAEATWVTYTGLVSYAHRSGLAGGQLIPGLARALPRVSDGQRLYTLTLRRGLVYSDGRPVRASDFVFSLQRAVKLWPAAPQLLDHTVAGAAAFAAGRARTIAGVSADDRTGQITIRLTAPDGGFAAVLAEPALGLIPAGSRSLTAGTRDPPPGCGPYVITRVVPGRSYVLVRNPHWRALPGIPAGRVNVAVAASADVSADAEAVLNNTADLLDWATTIPAGLTSALQSKAGSRFAFVDTGTQTEYLFLNQAERPFASRLARRAVIAALDHARLDRIADGTLAPSCWLVGSVVTGQQRAARCAGGASGAGDLAQARGLVHRSGELGQPVIVWSPSDATARALMRNVTGTLDAIGFRASLRVLAAGDDGEALGDLTPGPQIGLATFTTGADPAAALVRRLDANVISQAGNENFGDVDDSGLDAALARLQRQTLPGSGPWQRIDERIARDADVAVLGAVRFPFLASARMDYAALAINPVYGWDFTSLRLN